MTLEATARDRVYTTCSYSLSKAGAECESLFLARLALLLFEQVGDESKCIQAIEAASHELPKPSLSAK